MATIGSHTAFSLLIVEDDKASRVVIARMVGLKFPGCTIHTADNGRQGLALFKEYLPDMVVTDINMPEMDGIEMAREIRKINANATYIVLTAYGNKSYSEQFEEIGYCAFLLKPVDFNELFAMIERCSQKSLLLRE